MRAAQRQMQAWQPSNNALPDMTDVPVAYLRPDTKSAVSSSRSSCYGTKKYAARRSLVFTKSRADGHTTPSGRLPILGLVATRTWLVPVMLPASFARTAARTYRRRSLGTVWNSSKCKGMQSKCSNTTTQTSLPVSPARCHRNLSRLGVVNPVASDHQPDTYHQFAAVRRLSASALAITSGARQ